MMRIREPIATRDALRRNGLLTIEQIASALSMSTHTVSKALRGKPIYMSTVSAFADALGCNADDIAEFAGEEN